MYAHYETDKDTIRRVHDLVMWGSAGLVALILCFQNLLFMVVGGGYAACQAYFMLVMTNPIQALICETTSYGIVLKEKPIYNVISSSLGVIISAIVTINLIESLGVLAAALGVAASSVVIGVLRTVIGQRYYKSISSPLKTMITSGLILIACGVNGLICSSLSLELIAGVTLFVIVTILYRSEVVGFFRSLIGR